ncbi:hypothetical protein [Acetobacter sp. DsW_063]|uniref:hypothetical protein n=1 Tax=Acetobacter sp. DsW_063 TaxID=1514894 RepID=UPI0018E9D491|nr:hypothetical protein [Acetobacter sp. DsW_063]
MSMIEQQPSVSLTEAELREADRRQRGRIVGLVSFTLAMAAIIYVIALIRL